MNTIFPQILHIRDFAQIFLKQAYITYKLHLNNICFVLMGLTDSFPYLVNMEHPLDLFRLIFLNGKDLLLCVLKFGGSSHK